MNTLSESKIFLSRISLYIFIFFASPCVYYAQTAPGIEGQKCLGGTLSDDSTRGGYPTPLFQTSDGGYIMVGGTNSTDGNIIGNHGLDDVWVVKLSSLGTIEWQKCLGGTGTEEADCIIQTSDKGYAICGWTNSNDGDVSGNHGGFSDAWVIKIDSFGNIEWQKCLGGTGWDEANSIIQTSDRGFAIAGWTSSTIDESFLNHGETDAYVVKLDSSGNLQWQKSLGGTGVDGAGSILQTSEGGYIFAGTTDSYNGDVSGNHGDTTVNGISSDIWVVKLNPYGRIIWQKCFGGSLSEEAMCVIHTTDDGYVIAGSTNSTDGDVSGYHKGVLHNDLDAWVIKIDSSGKLLWQKCYGGSKDEGAFSIIQTPDSGYAFAGRTTSNDGDVSGKHGGVSDSSDIWVVKLTSSGIIQWQKCLGGTDEEDGYAIIQTADSGYAIYGRTKSNDGDVSGNHGDGDIWIVKLGGTAKFSVNSSIGSSSFAWVYPNPSIDQIHLQLYHSMPVTQMQFYNLLGVQYFPEYQIENTTATVDVHNLPVGSYIVRVLYTSPGGGEIAEVQKFLHFH